MGFVSRHKWLTGLGVVVVLCVVAAFAFQWDWLIPVVERQASAALGRPVTITHLHVQLGRRTHIEADGVTIENPSGWPGGGNFATVERLGFDFELGDYIRHRAIEIPNIELQSPKIDAQQLADGKANWSFGSSGTSSGPGPELGVLRITDGHVHFRDVALKSDFNVDVATKDVAPPSPAGAQSAAAVPAGATPPEPAAELVATAKGTYANQPITAQFVGGALLSLRDAKQPYPVQLKLANGPTTVNLAGTVQNPLSFAGANIKLDLAGPDMSLLLPLVGFAIPKTPAYRVAGKLDYAAGTVKVTELVGRVGTSDLEGNLEVQTNAGPRTVVTADVRSKMVDLKDLGGFIGAEPGDAEKGTKRVVRNTGKVLPNDPISVPKLNTADIHLKYRAGHIEGRRQPLDNMVADLDIVDGNIHLHPLAFGLGTGKISGDIALSEAGTALHTKATVEFQRISIDRLLTSAGVGRGAGTIGGRMVIDGTGRSIGEMLGKGTGELKLYMGSGGNLSALLVDISGLQFGKAFLSALGVPDRATIQCVVIDMPVTEGIAQARTVLVDTDENRLGVTGFVNLRSETIDLVSRTESKHFSVGSLPTPIDIKGTLSSPDIAPEAGPLALRGGAAVALGVLGTPLAALIPTIQFGTGEDGACSSLLKPVGQAAPARQRRR